MAVIPDENRIDEMKMTNFLASVQAGPLSRWNWNLEMLVFREGGTPKHWQKNLRRKEENHNQLSPCVIPRRNRIRGTLMGGERSHHCAISKSFTAFNAGDF